jgi:hypothetical protein
MLYPIPSELPASYDRVLALLAAAYKYDMDAVQSSIRAEVAAHGPSPTEDGAQAQAFRAYAIASSNGLTPEAEMAARLTLDQPLTFEHLGDELRWFEGWALRALVRFRKDCRDNLVSCLESFLDIESGPSKIWADYSHHDVSFLLLVFRRSFVPLTQVFFTLGIMTRPKSSIMQYPGYTDFLPH